MFTKCLAEETWEHGINVNELIPGPVATYLTRGGGGNGIHLGRTVFIFFYPLHNPLIYCG